MTFQDRKDKGKDWNKVKEKREELHERDEKLANQPDAVLKQDQETAKAKKEE
ncbi:hypothetical protein [Pedobacter alpinus]|uniref:General stress protein CsbD n=1 Tax=Pedobacter alpinus TaxID=1590643 RepID=A0ABW5TUW4_9SPHI